MCRSDGDYDNKWYLECSPHGTQIYTGARPFSFLAVQVVATLGLILKWVRFNKKYIEQQEQLKGFYESRKVTRRRSEKTQLENLLIPTIQP